MDLTDTQWEILAPLISEPPRRSDGRGRPWADSRKLLNGVHTGFVHLGYIRILLRHPLLRSARPPTPKQL